MFCPRNDNLIKGKVTRNSNLVKPKQNMIMTPEIIDEVQFTRSENFHLGEFIYMGNGKS